jgi:RNA 2',3'-cyclic 3'-phosphodiesterase
LNPPASVEGDERIRLFCALTLPEETVERVVEWQRLLKRQPRLPPGEFRVVPRENLHLTLAFLGHRPERELAAIQGELEQAARSSEPIVLRLRRYRETRSVGMLVFDEEDGRAAALAADLQERLQQLGVYEAERRPWLPHLTVVRFRERPRLAPDLPALGAVSPSGAAVYHSVLRPTGAQYVVRYAVGLARDMC